MLVRRDGRSILRNRYHVYIVLMWTKVVVALGDQKSRFAYYPYESRKRIKRTVIYAIVILYSVVNSIRFNENEIREFKGYENLTDEQARDVADFLAMWSIIVFDGMKRYGRD